MNPLLRLIKLYLCAGLFAAQALAAPTPPQLMLSRLTDDFLIAFQEQREALENDKGLLFDFVKQRVEGLFDTGRIARLVLGKHWKDATPDQRDAFARAFEDQLITTYAAALFQSDGTERVEFAEAEITQRRGRTLAKVPSEVILTDQSPVAVDYHLLLDEQSEEWRIYNLSVAGLNMIGHFRTTYAETIRVEGIPALIASLEETSRRNRQ